VSHAGFLLWAHSDLSKYHVVCSVSTAPAGRCRKLLRLSLVIAAPTPPSLTPGRDESAVRLSAVKESMRQEKCRICTITAFAARGPFEHSRAEINISMYTAAGEELRSERRVLKVSEFELACRQSI
jgi:hypothetical protein